MLLSRHTIQEGKKWGHIFVPHSHHLMDLSKAILVWWWCLSCKARLGSDLVEVGLCHEVGRIDMETYWSMNCTECCPKILLLTTHSMLTLEPTTQCIGWILIPRGPIFHDSLRNSIYATIKKPHTGKELEKLQTRIVQQASYLLQSLHHFSFEWQPPSDWSHPVPTFGLGKD